MPTVINYLKLVQPEDNAVALQYRMAVKKVGRMVPKIGLVG